MKLILNTSGKKVKGMYSQFFEQIMIDETIKEEHPGKSEYTCFEVLFS